MKSKRERLEALLKIAQEHGIVPADALIELGKYNTRDLIAELVKIPELWEADKLSGMIPAEQYPIYTSQKRGAVPPFGDKRGVVLTEKGWEKLPSRTTLVQTGGGGGGGGGAGPPGPPGANGANGVGIEWLGTFALPPVAPTLNQAYRNSTNGIAYIWTGLIWAEMVEDGVDGLNATGTQGASGTPGAPGPNYLSSGTSTNLDGILMGDGSYVGIAVPGVDYEPVDAHIARTDVANIFTTNQTINCNSTTALLVEQTGVKNDVLVADTTNGRVGVGTDTPDTVLHVKVDNATPVVRLERNDATIGTDDIVARIEVEGQDAGAAGICAQIEAIGEGNAGETGWRISCGTAGSIAEVMRIDELGNVGIGVVDPDALLHLESVTGAVQRLTRKDITVTDDSIIGRIEFETQDTDAHGVAAFIQAEAEGTLGEVGLVLATGIGAGATERMRIDHHGVVTFTGAVTATGFTASGMAVAGYVVNAAGGLFSSVVSIPMAGLGAGTAQYQVIVSGANPYPAGWSGYLLDGTTGGKTVFSVTNTKTLTLTSTGDFNLTVPATGTAALLATANVFTVQQMVDGTSDQIQLRVQGHSTQTAHLQTWENSAAAEQITFDVPTQNTATLDVELVTNGNFDTNLSGWTTYGPIATVAVNAPGNGYNIGDVLTVVQTGGALGTLTVATLTGGAGTGVATVTLLAAGTGYTAATGLATTVAPAGGTNCTINVLTVTGWAWNAAQNATRTVVAGTGQIQQSINLANGSTYQVTITLVRTAGTLTETFGALEGSYGFNSSVTVSRTFKATATTAYILTFTPTATFGGSIDSVSVKRITTAVAANAYINNTDGSYGVEIRAGGSGLNNTFYGYRSGYYNTTGGYNSAQGYYALYSNTTGNQNSAQGYYALYSNTTGIQNSAQGTSALYSNTTGIQNSAQGTNALYSNTSGIYNTAQGVDALRSNTTGSLNSAQGMYALYSNTTGNQNSAQGYNALYSNTTGISNAAQGVNALYSNTTGSYNLAQGVDALRSNTTGGYNSAQGVYALYSNTTGNQNSAQGYYALYSNTTGGYNSAQGVNALYSNKPTSKAITSFANYGGTVAGTVKATSVGHGLSGITTKEITGTVNYNGSKSVTVIDVDNFYFTATWVATETGWWSIVTEGRYNIGIGYNAGRTLTTADSCTFIGYSAGYHASQLATATNSTAIGNGAYTAASNQIVLGNTSVTTFGIGTYNPTAHVQFTGVSDLVGLRIQGYSTQTSNMLEIQDSSSNIHTKFNVPGTAAPLENVFNETGSQYLDFRVESDNQANAIFLDASADTIAFGGTGSTGATVSNGGHLTLPDINFIPSTPSALGGDVNDYDLGTNTWIRLSGGAADRIVTGIVARGDGHYMIITNIGTTNKITFSHESGSSSAANRIITATGSAVELHIYESIFLLYDATSSRWREVIHA